MTERKTKRVADLTVGDLVLLNDPDGVGRILSKGPSRLFKAEGGCFRLDVRVTDGPHRGIDKTDLAQMSPEEWRRFCATMVTEFGASIRRQAQEGAR